MQPGFNETYDGRPTFTGVVYRKTIGNYSVYTDGVHTDGVGTVGTPEDGARRDGRVVLCELSNRIRKQLIYPTADPASLPHIVQKVIQLEHMDPLAVGDVVRYIQAEDGKGLIIEVLPRRNKLTRRSAVPKPLHYGAHPFEQIIVTNVDQVIAVIAAAQPDPKWNLLDRYLASAEVSEVPALICITKIDLVRDNDKELRQVMAEYERIGYPSVLTSSFTGEGIEVMREQLAGRTSVMVGKSGVGKTALLNKLEPGLGLRVKEVNQKTGKGKHTTTNLEMFALDGGGAIVDTPGTREFGLWEFEDDLALLFPEMRTLVGKCRFGLDCQHDEEPGCVIRKAVMDGQIDPRRYQSFLRLKSEALV